MLVNLKNNFLIAYLSALTLGTCNVILPGYEYNPQILGYLKLHTKPADWLTARVNCHNEGAILATPWTADFTSAVHKFQLNREQSLPFLFSGSLVTFPEEAYYKERLPNEWINVQRCGIFLASGTTGEIDCKTKLPFVCYANNGPLTVLTSVTTSTTPKITALHRSEAITTYNAPTGDTPSCGDGSGYEFYKETEHCYKFHTDIQRWTEANRTCTVEGAKLAVINSDIEARVIISLFGKYPGTLLKQVSELDRDFSMIGNYWNDDKWVTVDGQTTMEAGYDVWRFPFPNNETFYPYGSIHRDGTFINANNVYPNTFICEKIPA